VKTKLPLLVLACLALASQSIHAADTPPVEKADLVVYGGTPAGVMAAVAAARHGHTVALVDINAHVGGVVSGGLVATDMGDRATVGGLADDFFKRIIKFYTDKYGADSKEFKACRNGYTFEPHVAELIFEQMLKEQPGIKVWRSCRYRGVLPEFDRADGSDRITALVVDDIAAKVTRTFAGEMFIDASYEGDLMAGAHVPYRVGREARAEFGEYLAGVSMGPMEQRGLGDHRTMAYNYRVTLTSNTDNRVLFPKPEHYDPTPFIDTYGKRAKEGRAESIGSFFTTLDKAHPGAKYDANWFDWPGNSEGYADGSWETRDRIAATIRDRALSLLYYTQNDPELPESFRAESRKWGLPKDEFADSGHFPFQLYVREARRMVGAYVLREQDLTQDRWKPDGIANGGYGIDCHYVQMLREKGHLVPEHTRHVMNNNYDIPYRSLVPPDVANLLVPVCCSATHDAYCSLRMEPVYMMLGHASGDAAHLALTAKSSVQKVDTTELRELLRNEGAVLDAGYQPQVKIWWTPQHPKPGDKVIFKAIPSAANKQPLKQIAWDFTGDGKVSAEGERVVHVFDLEKVHSISLLVTDESGRKRLLTAEVPVGLAAAHDVTVDDFDADLTGHWDGQKPDYLPGQPLRYSDVHLGPGIHRDVLAKGKVGAVRARFQPNIERAGRYLVCLGFRPSKSQATNTPVLIKHAGGTAKLTVDERTETTPFNWTPLGEFQFKAGDSGFVDITNTGADGRVAIDGVRWVWLGE
jgi:FAD dependent oxidoreductase/PKD domain